MSEENLTNNSNPPNPQDLQAPPPAQAEPEPIVESAPTAQPVSVPTSEEVKVDFKPEQAREKEQTAASEGQPSENQQSESPQIAEEQVKLEKIEEIGEIEESTETTELPAESMQTAEPQMAKKQEEPKAPAISQQDLDRLSEQIIPSAQDISITEEQKKSFWQKVMQRLGQLSRKKRQNRWQMQKQAILKLLAQKGRIKNNDVEHALGVSHATAARYLQKLIKEELIERMGVKKKTFYLCTPKGQTAWE